MIMVQSVNIEVRSLTSKMVLMEERAAVSHRVTSVTGRKEGVRTTMTMLLRSEPITLSQMPERCS